MTIEINQLRIISKVDHVNEKEITGKGTHGNILLKEEKEEIINECLMRFKKYLERIEEV